MKISHVHISNYHSLKDFELDVDDYAIFIGPNGAGKSSVLYALDWFFNGRTLEGSDIHNFLDDNGHPNHAEEEIETDPNLDTIRVTITFDELTERDRKILQSYGKGQTAVFSKTWRLSENKEKYVGNALQGPGFAEIRSMTRVTEIRPAYRGKMAEISGLPDLGSSPSKDEVFAALQSWEDDLTNITKLIPINDADASHLFGFNGQNVLHDCINLVLVPASGDMTAEIALNKKGSALNDLIGSLINNASAVAKQEWIQRYQGIINELTTAMRSSIDTSTRLQSERVNDRLDKLIPSASVEFGTWIPDWIPNPIPEISTKVSIDGSQRDISKQGNGVQRAVMIAMFESLAPDRKFIEGTYIPEEGLTEDEAKTKLNEILIKLPAIIICIEEPEIYQHPVRARAFGRILYDLSTQANAQVLIATHSPYFVQPKQFTSIRRFSLVNGYSTCKHTTISEIATNSIIAQVKINKIVEMQLPTTFSEGFFSDKVALVEGGTDKAVLEAIGEKIGTPFDTLGISILEMSGKEGLQIPYLILESLGTPTYIVVDGDSLGALRKYPSDPTKQRQADSSKENSTNKVIAWLPSSSRVEIGTLPYSYRDPTIVTDKFTIWLDDIEEELGKWTSFCSALSANGGVLGDEKNLQAYRHAVMEATIDDIPDTLRKCVDAIASF
jgi:putative ATP-dependent endonuclease of the OLD family